MLKFFRLVVLAWRNTVLDRWFFTYRAGSIDPGMECCVNCVRHRFRWRYCFGFPFLVKRRPEIRCGFSGCEVFPTDGCHRFINIRHDNRYLGEAGFPVLFDSGFDRSLL